MSDTPAEIAAQIADLIEQYSRPGFYAWILSDPAGAQSDPMKRAREAKEKLTELAERIRELEQRVEQAESGERGALNQLQGLEQANKELLEALRKLWKHTPQIDNGYCAVCRCAHRFWERGQPGPCQDSRCLSHVVRAALSKHGGTR